MDSKLVPKGGTVTKTCDRCVHVRGLEQAVLARSF